MSKQGHDGEKKKNKNTKINCHLRSRKRGLGVLDGERKPAIPGLSILQTSIWNVAFTRGDMAQIWQPGVNIGFSDLYRFNSMKISRLKVAGLTDEE